MPRNEANQLMSKDWKKSEKREKGVAMGHPISGACLG